MPRKTRAQRLADDMRRLGIARDDGISFGRPRVAGTGVPVAILADLFLGGDGIQAIANDYSAAGVTAKAVTNAIRFAMLWPKSDLESFWRSLA